MEEVKVGNKLVKARQYPWGTVQGNVIRVQLCLDSVGLLCYVRLCWPLVQFRCTSYNLWSVPIN